MENFFIGIKYWTCLKVKSNLNANNLTGYLALSVINFEPGAGSILANCILAYANSNHVTSDQILLALSDARNNILNVNSSITAISAINPSIVTNLKSNNY